MLFVPFMLFLFRLLESHSERRAMTATMNHAEP